MLQLNVLGLPHFQLMLIQEGGKKSLTSANKSKKK